MTRNYFLGGQNRPVLFGMAANYEFEVLTGKTPAQAFTQHAQKVSEGFQGIPTKLISDLLNAGLRCSALKAGKPIDWNVYDVAEWIGLLPESDISNIVTHFTDSQPWGKPAQEGGTEDKGEANTVPDTGTT